jgi:Tfp pilus assembly protein PilF
VLIVNHLKEKARTYGNWISRWRCLPVGAWIKAAEYYQKGAFETAAELYQDGLRSNPHSPAKLNALLDLAHCLFRLRKFEEAENYLRQATVVAPQERESYVRLARLQLWLGHATEAVWTIRVCIQRVSVDPELAALFITAVVESGGNVSTINEAQEILATLHCDHGFPRLEVARARLALLAVQNTASRDNLSKLASMDRGPFEAVVAFAEVLLREGKLAYARHHLHRSLVVAPEHPKVLRLLAQSYLSAGMFFEPEYGVQLAQKACQATAWRGVNEMLTLAQAYILAGDKAAALVVASRAKDIAARLIGTYPEVARLEQMLQSSASGTQV